MILCAVSNGFLLYSRGDPTSRKSNFEILLRVEKTFCWRENHSADVPNIFQQKSRLSFYFHPLPFLCLNDPTPSPQPPPPPSSMPVCQSPLFKLTPFFFSLSLSSFLGRGSQIYFGRIASCWVRMSCCKLNCSYTLRTNETISGFSQEMGWNQVVNHFKKKSSSLLALSHGATASS